ncbi:MAG: hypothetical protein CMI63_20340 [Parvularcula sp.]|nr:hypothetical protein [Parvularcula sp.]
MSAFDSKQKTYRHRNEVDVVLTLSTSDTPVAATMFLSLGERASDLLNDDRAFIPVRLGDGDTMIIAKSQIASIVEAAGGKPANGKSKIYGEDFSTHAKKEEAPSKTFDPYAMLRIQPTASDQEVRAAYKARMKAVHPDTFASLGLDEEIAKAAVLATQKVNYAYQKIMRDRSVKQTDRKA